MGKLVRNGIEYGGTGTIDRQLSSSSKNPVQNRIISEALAGKQNTLTISQMEAVNSGITANDIPIVISKTDFDNLTTKTAKYYLIYDDYNNITPSSENSTTNLTSSSLLSTATLSNSVNNIAGDDNLD